MLCDYYGTVFYIGLSELYREDEWGALVLGCAELALSLTSVTLCVTQVMNMYGDLVMDAAPEKVGKTCTHTHIYS